MNNARLSFYLVISNDSTFLSKLFFPFQSGVILLIVMTMEPFILSFWKQHEQIVFYGARREITSNYQSSTKPFSFPLEFCLCSLGFCIALKAILSQRKYFKILNRLLTAVEQNMLRVATRAFQGIRALKLVCYNKIV